MDPSLIVIASGSSSGSHLLARLLCHFPPLCAGPELQILSQPGLLNEAAYKKTLHDGLKLDAPFHVPFLSDTASHLDLLDRKIIANRKFYSCSTQEQREMMVHSTNSILELIAYLKKDLIEQHGWKKDAVLIDHAPMSSIMLNEAVEKIPGLKVIHIVRDLRDVIASMRSRRAIGPRFKDLTVEEIDNFTAQQWSLLNHAANQIDALPNYVRIRYEELVKNPLRTVVDALRAIKINYVHQAKRDISVNIELTKQEGWRNSPNQKVSDQSVNRYEDELTPETVNRIFQLEFDFKNSIGTVCPADLQKLYGYPTDFSPTRFS
ncbi:sulfotransferase [Sneathiella limimaris]|uniref:sulfotransferase n=1 Tax=Sneathiella limimaris TaxID=1964213 RepID=UPI00146D81BA|nr:sulfotransferase [Sneathiella limimaris]